MSKQPKNCGSLMVNPPQVSAGRALCAGAHRAYGPGRSLPLRRQGVTIPFARRAGVRAAGDKFQVEAGRSAENESRRTVRSAVKTDKSISGVFNASARKSLRGKFRARGALQIHAEMLTPGRA